MAHHSKIAKGNTAGGINLLDHDKRTPNDRHRSNDNIDPELTHLNRDYSARKMDAPEAWNYALDFAQKHASRKIRDNGVVISCEVMHLPKNWDEVSGGLPSEKFFEDVALPFYRARYGRENLANEVSAVLHKDEKRIDGHEGADHLHYKYVPITSDGRLSHKDVNNRLDLQTFHRDLADFAEARGYRGLALYDEQRAASRTEKALTLEEYKEAMIELEKVQNRTQQQQLEFNAVSSRLESLRREEDELTTEVSELEQAIEQKELEPPSESVAESARKLFERRRADRGARSLEIANQRLRERVRGLEADKSELEAEKGRLERGISKIQSQIKKIGEQVNQLMQQIIDRPEKPCEKPQEQSFETPSLADLAKNAREVSDAQASDFARSSYYDRQQNNRDFER
jgi:predicted  nucleic acid-binding Zn-ribbon protein